MVDIRLLNVRDVERPLSEGCLLIRRHSVNYEGCPLSTNIFRITFASRFLIFLHDKMPMKSWNISQKIIWIAKQTNKQTHKQKHQRYKDMIRAKRTIPCIMQMVLFFVIDNCKAVPETKTIKRQSIGPTSVLRQPDVVRCFDIGPKFNRHWVYGEAIHLSLEKKNDVGLSLDRR